jgi:dTMP kinase
VTVEGPDGSGKTTQADLLAAHLRSAGVPCTSTREPGGTAVGERVRDLVLADSGRGSTPPTARTDALLFNAARSQLVSEVVRPALVRGEVVVCARFSDSTIAYQGHGAGLPIDALRAVETFATSGLRPDLTILLDLPAEEGLRRKAAGEVTRFETAFDLAFHERVRAGFLAIAAAEPARLVVVDAGAPVDDVARRVLDALHHLPDPLGRLAALWSGPPAESGRSGSTRTGEPTKPPVRMNE